MKLSVQTPRKFLNPLLSQKSISSSGFLAFKASLFKYVQDIEQLKATKQTEANIVAAALMPLLQANSLNYNCRPHSQKGQSGIDLAILSGNDVAVIIEAKVAGSKDMIKKHDLNCKAFHEAIFYFMQERKKGNDKLTHIVITDFYKWFVFDAKDFDHLFWRNNQLKKFFHAYHDPNLLTKTTADVYAAFEGELPKMLADLITEETIDCAYFDVTTPSSIKDDELVAVYKLLSPDGLLKAFNPNDANSLNREFYDELLYIVGLQEVKDGGKRLIQAAGTAGSMYDGIAEKLNQKGASHTFEDVIKLIIIWINRILFLKLLESQIGTWTGDKVSSFLTAEKISGYNALENLFFDTLARQIPERKYKGFDYIPYLNSSLFEMQEDEKVGISISALPDDALIAYYGKTVVKDKTQKRKSGQTKTLAYLFEFLDAYDFANDSGDEVREEAKSLISASVLGLIFEKINGYKDGSFYTPSFVTMYMARQSIEKAVLQKFNEKYSWTCTALTGEGGLKNEIKDHKIKKPDSNALIDSLKICDPAVGSGHFLVSVLNEILRIKSDLGLLVDESGNMLNYNISIANDELIMTSDEGDFFEYKKGNKAKTLIQKTLFLEKQKIIENCLFGVDINPNSVNICRLRLWIELLKSAYYQADGTLDTLPNIDINIKCGNSLISRFALNIDLKDALKKSKISVDEYRAAVSSYRNTSDKTQKRQIESLIADIKSKFSKDLQANDPKFAKLKKAKDTLKTLQAQNTLFEDDEKKKKEKLKRIEDLKIDVAKLEKIINDIKNSTLFKDAIEWRLEFPEVMNAAGGYVGFDVVIGNPPYGVSIAHDARKVITSTLGKVPDYGIQYFFINLAKQILRSNGINTFIVPNSLLFNVFAKKYREDIIKNWQVNEILDCTEFNIFDEATVRCVIPLITNSSTNGLIAYKPTLDISSFSELTEQKTAYVRSEELLKNNQNWGLVFKLKAEILSLTKKIRTQPRLSESFGASQGYIPYRLSDLKKKYGAIEGKSIVKNRKWHSSTKKNDEYIREIWGESISKFGYTLPDSFVWYGSHLAGFVNLKFFNQSRLLIREITNPTIIACLVDEELVNDPQIISIIPNIGCHLTLKTLWAVLNSKVATFFHFNASPKATKGAFPKILVEDIKNFPVPQISEQDQSALVSKVEAILQAKLKGTNTSALEREIDNMVYRLYDLTYVEVKTIEPEFKLSQKEYETNTVH